MVTTFTKGEGAEGNFRKGVGKTEGLVGEEESMGGEMVLKGGREGASRSIETQVCHAVQVEGIKDGSDVKSEGGGEEGEMEKAKLTEEEVGLEETWDVLERVRLLEAAADQLEVVLRMCLHVCVCQSVSVSVYVSVYLSVCLSVCLSVYLIINLTVCLSVRASMHPSVRLSVYLGVYVSGRL